MKTIVKNLFSSLFFLSLASTVNAQDISSTDSYKLIQKMSDVTSDFVILDVRTENEYKSGHIKNAQNIDYYESEFKVKLQSLNRETTYLVYCRSGNRSSKTLNIMKKLGFKNLYNMAGGITSWSWNNLPIE